MWFKKIKLKKKPTLVLNISWFVGIITIFIIWFLVFQNINFINLSFLNEDWKIKFTKWVDEKETEEDDRKDKINILAVWRWWISNDAPNLTDTIILASINSKYKTISMLSIPRDLYVTYWNKRYWKINQVFAMESNKYDSKELWMKSLEEKITEITWEKIDYFVNVDFDWFVKIIDTIWWIELTIPKQFVDSTYPDWNWWYKTVIFKKWTWIFDWENALKYARSRHSTSDFDRSLRQQQIIDAVKEKMTTSYLITSPLKVKKLYNVFKEYVFTDLELNDIIKLAIKLKVSDYKTQSFNINNSCYYWTVTCEKWGFLYNPDRNLFGWASVLLPRWGSVSKITKYDEINKYSSIIFNYPLFFQENYKINIFNSLKINFLASEFADKLKLYWFNVPEKNSIWNTKEIHKESIIYYNNIDKNSETLKILKDLFPKIKFEKVEWPKYAKELDTQIEIIIWEDYKEIFK